MKGCFSPPLRPKQRVCGVSTGLVTLELVLFPFVFQARLHNGQSVTVLTSWKVSSTGVPTRNHTNGANWKQDSSKVKLKGGLKCDLTLETWMPMYNKKMNMHTRQSGVNYCMWEIQSKVHCAAVVQELQYWKEELKHTATFWQFTISR